MEPQASALYCSPPITATRLVAATYGGGKRGRAGCLGFSQASTLRNYFVLPVIQGFFHVR